MGLAGRKIKQRIGTDPRNLAWSGDSSKFGTKYLQSLGWTAGTGLGASGEGRISNLKIHQKLDLMGIGANRRGTDGEDAGWRGGRDFEGLLARLNQAQNADTQDISIDDGNVTDTNNSVINQAEKEIESITAKQVGSCSLEPSINRKEGKTKRGLGDGEQKKKRKKDTTEDEELDQKEIKRRRKLEKKRKRDTTEDKELDAKEVKRRRKQEKKDKEQRRAEKAAKKNNTSHSSEHGIDAAVDGPDNPDQEAEMVKTIPRYRAHRARNLASKRLAAASATGMNEILGISSYTASARTTAPSAGDVGRTLGLGLSPVNDHVTQAADGMAQTGLGFRGSRKKSSDDTEENRGDDLLRKSGKSVAEYFAEKMRMKGAKKTTSGINDT